jgi:dTDP-4-dehydrorhamnose reductase
MRAMILGAGGMLGHDLVRPTVILNAAAYTAVDRAESEAELAFRVNGAAVGELGRIAARAGVRVVHFSTDYVFDGKASNPYQEQSPTDPVNTYGASKLAGERALRESGADWLILRTQWLFGVHGRSFPRTMWERAVAGLATSVVQDQTGSPTYTKDLARATWALIARGASNLFHVTNAGQATWFDFALHVFSRVGRPHLLAPCTTEQYPTPARRPHYSVLDTGRLRHELGAPLPDWRCAVDDLLHF